MTNRFNLPDLNFFDKDPDVIEREMLFHVAEKTGLTLQRADPRRKFLQSLIPFISIERNRLDHKLKQNRLAYAEDDALLHMGFEMSTERLGAKAAVTTMVIILEEDRPGTFIIKAGSLVGEEPFFKLDDDVIVPLGETIVTVGATCVEKGEIGNGFLPGEITTFVEPVAYVKTVQNTTISSDGVEEESDDAYAERIHLAPESFSVAGSELAYVYWAKSASQEIVDATVDSPVEGEVDIRVLMRNGRIPTEEEIKLVEETVSSKKVRPLTDKVAIGAPNVVEYEAVVEYWIARKNATISTIIEEQVNSAFQKYQVWQREKMGRDVDLSELIARLKQAGASRVAVNSEMFIEVNKIEVAHPTLTSLTLRGLADD
ncbi:baseplate J/gp47 family protein [Lysinibacillus sp. RC79]|uniref:baseplate assembly protein n=1 Tax=Lysinibacillus sp. RC79 TaxID=3156296 RepID=UPI0035192720